MMCVLQSYHIPLKYGGRVDGHSAMGGGMFHAVGDPVTVQQKESPTLTRFILYGLSHMSRCRVLL